MATSSRALRRREPLRVLARWLGTVAVSLLALGVAWELWIRLADVSPLVAPAPLDVLGDIGSNVGVYVAQLKYTIGFAIAGLALGTLGGALCAVLSWMTPLLRGLLTPPVLIMQSVPVVAMLPVLARLFGYNWHTVLIITAIISFFPAFVFVDSGLNAAPRSALDLCEVLGGSRRARLSNVVLPAAVPSIFAATKLSGTVCILAALVAEFLMGTNGLGSMIALAFSDQSIVRAWGASVIAMAISVAAFAVTTRLEHLMRERWT